MDRQRFTRQRQTAPLRKLPKALLAAGDHELRGLFCRALERASYEVIACPRTIDFLARLAEPGAYDLVVCDVQWLDELSIHVIHRLQQQQQYPPLVLIDVAEQASTERVVRLRAAAVIRRPLEVMRHVAHMHSLAASTTSGTRIA